MMPAEIYNDASSPKNLSYTYARKYGILVSDLNEKTLTIAYKADCPPEAIIELCRYYDQSLDLVKVDADTFTRLLTKNYEKTSGGAIQMVEQLEGDVDFIKLIHDIPNSSDILENEKGGAPVIMLMNSLLREAIRKAASDIHIETFEKILVVRFRIDGILYNIIEIPFQLAPLLISRVKVMAKLDISEKRMPQDGRITVRIAERNVDVRVSTIPASHGERIVLRLLDKKSVHLNLSDLGTNIKSLESMHRMIKKPHGMILVTGPTGSGKTTTLYAMLSELNITGSNIMTVEDPIEYDLAGIAQIQVNQRLEMDFARSLRAILRQDPNVIMIGEIRDIETAIIAIQASLTGHLVFSTLHTNTAVGAVTRLRDMGIESFLLSSCLVGIIAQRLIRLLCSSCKEAYQPSADEAQLLKLPLQSSIRIYRPKGCEYCNQTGYSRRIGIYEIVEVDAELKSMIHQNASEQAIETYIVTKAPSIWQDSCERVITGLTSLEEIVRVTKEL